MAPQVLILLGNPGREYAQTRHNAGYLFGDHWTALRGAAWQKKFKGEWTSISFASRKIYVLRPETFMNLVGESARALSDFLKIPPEAWVAVHDDLELPWGEVRFQTAGGLAGHNGLRSLKQHGGTDQFHRVRIGIGRPARGDIAQYVLSRFSAEEIAELPRVMDTAAGLVEQALLKEY